MFGGAALFVMSCDHQSSASAPPGNRPVGCPACECKCACEEPAGGGASRDDVALREEAADLVDTISRKLAKRDGTCLAEVTRLEKLSPRYARTYLLYRAQCSMLAGKCEAGKEAARTSFSETGSLLREQVDRAVESMSSMYCTGPLDPRGELLRASLQLQTGAYSGNIGVRACQDAFATVQLFRDRVRPIDDDDTMVTSAQTHSHFTAAACLGRAGDCNAAFETFTSVERKAEWARNVKDRALLERLLRDNFVSVVRKCSSRVPPP
jgi:hypothetical protein